MDGIMDSLSLWIIVLGEPLYNGAQIMAYDESLPGYGDLIPLAEYLKCVAEGGFIDYDGNGHPVKDGMMDESITILPSKPERIPKDATHIMWFNR